MLKYCQFIVIRVFLMFWLSACKQLHLVVSLIIALYHLRKYSINSINMVLSVEGNWCGYESKPHIFVVNNKHFMISIALQMNHVSWREKTNISCAATDFPLDGAIVALQNGNLLSTHLCGVCAHLSYKWLIFIVYSVLSGKIEGKKNSTKKI